LAAYCLNALAGAAQLKDRTAVRRLVAVTLDGLRRGGEAVAKTARAENPPGPKRE
jgi:hypothetical protein